MRFKNATSSLGKNYLLVFMIGFWFIGFGFKSWVFE
jgi:hypothetical protein